YSSPVAPDTSEVSAVPDCWKPDMTLSSWTTSPPGTPTPSPAARASSKETSQGSPQKYWGKDSTACCTAQPSPSSANPPSTRSDTGTATLAPHSACWTLCTNTARPDSCSPPQPPPTANRARTPSPNAPPPNRPTPTVPPSWPSIAPSVAMPRQQ